MKKSLKVILATSVASICAFGGAMLSGCLFETQSFTGEYHYYYYSEYGIKVSVEVQSDSKGDRIRKVEVVDSDYIEVSAPHGDVWTEEKVANWNDNLNSLLLKYRGAYIMDVLEEIVVCQDTGAPSSVSNDDYVISGATQGSGRLMLAVQDALLNSLDDLGYKVLEGEYHYANAWAPSAPHYGIKVNVYVKGDAIMGVKKMDSEYVEVSAANPDSGWTDDMVAKWNDNLVSLLKAYNGRKIADILAVNVTLNGNNVPITVSDSDFVITDATQGSGRLMKAVQDALSKLN